MIRPHPSRAHVLGALWPLGAYASESFLSPAAAAETYAMRLGTAEPASSAMAMAALRFAAAVNRRTDGQLKIEVYPSYPLAKQDETTRALPSRVLDFAIIPTSVLLPLVPPF